MLDILVSLFNFLKEALFNPGELDIKSKNFNLPHVFMKIGGILIVLFSFWLNNVLVHKALSLAKDVNKENVVITQTSKELASCQTNNKKNPSHPN